MTLSNDTTADQFNGSTRNNCCWGADANWTTSNIVALVLGFVVFWPIGLFFLYWIMRGRNITDLPGRMSGKWSNFKNGWSGKSNVSDNDVFNEYQQTQYDRIREIKDEIKDRAKRFTDYRADAKRRADEEEFRRFMADNPGKE